MSRTSPMKGKNLGHREYIRCRLIFDFFNNSPISSRDLSEKYYGELSQESFHKTFKRDREALEKEGVYLIERKDGQAKSWSLDKKRSLADTSTISKDERRGWALLLRSAQSSPHTAQKNALGSAIARIGQIGSGGLWQLPTLPPNCKKEVLATFLEALEMRKPINLTYTSAKETKATERIFYPYGTFSLARNVYAVGLRKRDGAPDALRTLNLERVKGAAILENEPIYTIPSTFKIADYQYLPFEIGDEAEQTIRLYVDKDVLNTFKDEVKKRGSLQINDDGSATWSGSMKNLEMAAMWSAGVGAIPLAPTALVEAWKKLLSEALNEH